MGARSNWKHIIILTSRNVTGDYCITNNTGILRIEAHSIYIDAHVSSVWELVDFMFYVQNILKNSFWA